MSDLGMLIFHNKFVITITYLKNLYQEDYINTFLWKYYYIEIINYIQYNIRKYTFFIFY